MRKILVKIKNAVYISSLVNPKIIRNYCIQYVWYFESGEMQNYRNNALLGGGRAVNQEICIMKQIFGEIKKIIRDTIIN